MENEEGEEEGLNLNKTDVCGKRYHRVLIKPKGVHTVVCVMNLAACTGDAAQSLCSSHGVVGRLRREPV